MQDTLPIGVSDRLAAWRAPLARDLERLTALKPRLLQLQFGGAAGTLDKLGSRGRRWCGGWRRRSRPSHAQVAELAQLSL